MAAGKFKHQITLQKPVYADDGMSGKTASWQNLATVRAAVWPLKGAEAVEAAKETGSATYRIRIRPLSSGVTLTAACRAVWNGRALELIAPPITLDALPPEVELLTREKT